MTIKTKRAYDVAATKDGQRILVDRIWPRGVSKEEAKVHEWLKSIGPSHELRKWFNHDEEKYDTFKEEYKQELKSGEQKEALDKLKEIADRKSTRLNSSHVAISYAVFCLKKKNGGKSQYIIELKE